MSGASDNELMHTPSLLIRKTLLFNLYLYKQNSGDEIADGCQIADGELADGEIADAEVDDGRGPRTAHV